MTHEAGKDMQLGNRVSEAEGINKLCWALRPKLHIHGHYNVSKVYMNHLTETPTIALAFDEIVALRYENGQFSTIV